ncbi:MAG: TonB family protein [Bacteroidetes bacterium]|nr:TonB family protein [Bacteroidota bacterium]
MGNNVRVGSVDSSPAYGARNLKSLVQRYTTIGMGIAVVMHMTAVGVYWGSQYLGRETERSAPVVMLKYSELGPPPSITHQQALPQVMAATQMAKPSVGIPVPVPDASVSPEQTIATQRELSKIAGPITQHSGGGDSVGVSMGDFKVPTDDGPPPDFVPVEKEPQIIRGAKPEYPDLAQRAGIEGRVIVKIWVDREGKPRKAIVLKSDAEMFNKPAVDAAMQHRFTPAIMNQGPVAVWVVIPFTFQLTR